MARVVLIGSGPLPWSHPEEMGFPQLRTDHFLAALLGAGHEVTVLALEAGAEPAARREGPEGCWTQVAVDRRSPDRVEAARDLIREVRPDVVVSAGPFEPARVAALAVGDEPLWVDVPGDPFAEAEAKAAHLGPARRHEPTLEMRAAWLPALARADAFSAVSGAQRHALLGQLGLMGRLAASPLGQDAVHVVPVAWRFGALSEDEPHVRSGGSPLRVALSGGYNTWFDADTLLEGLHLAMRRVNALTVVSTGGAITDHHDATYEAFRTQATHGPFAGRFTFHGWVPHGVLGSLLKRCHVGICLDRPGHEAELGSRTRVPFLLHQGLDVLCTPRSDLTRELAGLHMVLPVRPQDPQHLAAGLEALWRRGQEGRRVRRAQAWLASRCAVDVAATGLLGWVRSPSRLARARLPEADLAEEVARLRAELALIHASPTWQLGGRAQALWRRGQGRIDRLLRGR